LGKNVRKPQARIFLTHTVDIRLMRVKNNVQVRVYRISNRAVN